MNRLLTGAITAAGSLALVGGVIVAAAMPAAAVPPPSGNSSYGASAPAGPVTSPPLATASQGGTNSVIASNVDISGLLTTGATLDTASALTAFSRVSSPIAAASAGGDSLSLVASQVSSTCRSDTLTASAHIVGGVLDFNGAITHLPQQPSVGQSFPLDGGSDGTVTLNQHVVAPGGGVEVQAVHIHFTSTSPAQDLYLGVSVCSSPGTLGNTVTVTSPGDQTNNSGAAITPLQIVATDSDPGQVLTYTATGLPPGLSINPTTGVISGTPTTGSASAYTVTVRATDTSGATGSTSFNWTIDNVVSVTNPGPQSGVVGTPVNLPITASDSDLGQVLTYSATGLPPGLSINSSTGVISGSPTTAIGSPFSVTVHATDTTSATDSATFTFTITSPNTVTVTNPGSQTSTVSVAISPLAIVASDTAVVTPGALTYSATGLPPGLSINSSTGVISGTPTTTTGSPFSVTVHVTDATGATGSTTFTWTIAP